MNLDNACTQFCTVLHTAYIVRKEEHLRVTDAWNHIEIRIIIIDELKTRVGYFLFLTIGKSPFLQVLFPRSAERGIRNAEVICLTFVTVFRNCGTECYVLA